jgi:hypothetical protein
VTDRHIRILRLMARQSQQELHRHDAVDTRDAASTDRRQHLEHAATQTSARVADAQARRRHGKTSFPTATPGSAPSHVLPSPDAR